MTEARRPTVLLIDDDPDILKLMEYVFADEAFDLVTRRKPEEGLRVLAAGNIDCVLLDVHFAHTPECLGFLDAARSLPAAEGVPILATSAMNEREVARNVLERGARRFIPKPFFPGEILQEVRELVAWS